MAKGYVIVEIPSDCYLCRFKIYDEIMEEYRCVACDSDDNFMATSAGVPVWCPIKKLPEELLKPKFNPNYKINTYFEKYMNQTRRK